MTCTHAAEVIRLRAELDRTYAALAECRETSLAPAEADPGIRHERDVLYRVLALANGHQRLPTRLSDSPTMRRALEESFGDDAP